jgi:hypothetical protein
MRTYKELFLCIPVLALLCLLFTAAAPRKDAKQALCADNLRQILKLMQNYADTHGVMPPVWTQQKPLWRFWESYIDPYYSSRTFAACPSDVRNAHMYTEVEDPLVPQLRCTSASSYGMNEFMHTYNSKTRRATMHNFANPEKLIIFGDSKTPYLQPVQNPGAKRHSNRYHFITAAGNIRLYTDKDLGTRKPNGHFNVNTELWSPWRAKKK